MRTILADRIAKGKGWYSSSWEEPTSTGCHLPYGITQCYKLCQRSGGIDQTKRCI